MSPARPTFAANLAGTIRSVIRSVEEAWFDRSRGVHTRGNASTGGMEDRIGMAADAEIYVPARVANLRGALRSLPIRNPANYTFIDIGSGKGRVLFVAAEMPFRSVLGVEFSRSLHRQATENIARVRPWSQRCRHVTSILADAAAYEFPDDNLVLYLFNPFGRETMSRMLANLGRSLQAAPRHVLIVLLWPENADLVAAMHGMRPVCSSRRFHIYQNQAPTESARQA